MWCTRTAARFGIGVARAGASGAGRIGSAAATPDTDDMVAFVVDDGVFTGDTLSRTRSGAAISPRCGPP
jgi:hypothetical protein